MNQSTHSQDNEIRKAIDACFPSLDERIFFERDVLRQVRGEMKVKKKLSVGLVLVISLVLITATAFAVMGLREMGVFIAQTEQEQGYWNHWTTDQKVAVITFLTQQGYIEDTPQVQTLATGELNEIQSNEIADEAIQTLTGKEMTEIGFTTVMTSIWGETNDWSYEEKAWASQVLADAGAPTDGVTIYTNPTDVTIEEAQAIAIARSEIAKYYGIDESVLDAYLLYVSYEKPEFMNDQQSYWAIIHEAPKEMSTEDKLFLSLPLYIHPETGELLQSVAEKCATFASLPTVPSNALYQEITMYRTRAADEGAMSFREWSLELRAEFSKDIAPQVRAIVASDDLTMIMNAGHPDYELIAQSTYTYGMPKEDDLSQDKALAIATEALHHAYDLPLNLFEQYETIYVYYDCSDPSVPLWKFFFNPKMLCIENIENGYDNPLFNLCYKAEINAVTGDVICLEEFPFQIPGHDEAYTLKWY